MNIRFYDFLLFTYVDVDHANRALQWSLKLFLWCKLANASFIVALVGRNGAGIYFVDFVFDLINELRQIHNLFICNFRVEFIFFVFDREHVCAIWLWIFEGVNDILDTFGCDASQFSDEALDLLHLEFVGLLFLVVSVILEFILVEVILLKAIVHFEVVIDGKDPQQVKHEIKDVDGGMHN